MNYPVDLNKKYVLYNKKTEEAVKGKINIPWPRPDGMKVTSLDDNLIYLEYLEEEAPELTNQEKLVKTVSVIDDKYIISYKKEQKKETASEKFYRLLEEGYKVDPEGYTLDLNEESQNAFARLLTLLDISGASDSLGTQIADKEGVLHSITVGRLREILVSYGMYYQTIWVEYKNS